MAQTDLPVDTQWETFKFRMDNFLLALDSYTEVMKGKLAGLSRQHSEKMKDFDINKAELEDLIKAEKEKETRMCAALESERLAIGEKTKELETLTTQLAKQKDQIMQLESNHQGVLREIASIKETKTKQSQVLEEHLNKDERDLARIVELLGLDVQHVGNYFVCQYTKIDPNNPEEVYSIALEEEGGGKFKPSHMKPHLEGINRLAAKAQEERGHDRSMMLWFLNQVRLMFKSTVQEDDLNSMFGSLTTRPASAKSTSTSTAEK
ncbi:hypothetical protein HD553DRAFT_348466 [Filobasidium floriforme]|uniref:uncharacterized protein n=1 Tax=Filobasidium floriforme TaxID=5210 RepID=UPI001E8D2F88|nr:uncharacterized protein HD553DRAFT_348466 [Filobasidium floriforme]KAH8087910.1 hypothetical protein HD553DRAFT_348466 [Filobasidium floriforme]